MAGQGKTLGSGASKTGLQFPIAHIARSLKSRKYAKRVTPNAPVYLAAVLEYIAAEVLELAGNEARDANKPNILMRHIEIALRKDEGLNKLLGELMAGLMMEELSTLVDDLKVAENSMCED